MSAQKEYIINLEEKVRAYSREISKKDEIIRKIAGMDTSSLTFPWTATELTNIDRQPSPILNKPNLGDKIKEFLEIEQDRDLLRRRVGDLEKQLSDMSSRCLAIDEQYRVNKLLGTQSSEQVEHLEKELLKEKQHVSQLEERLEHQTLEREKCEYDTKKAEERLEYFVTQMMRIFDEYVREDELSGESWKDENKIIGLLDQASRVVDENLKQKGRIQELSNRVTERERQIAERNSTVDRLGQQLMKTSEADRGKESLIFKLECSRGNERALEAHVNQLTRDLLESQSRVKELERELTQTTEETKRALEMRDEVKNEEFGRFKESLASLLSSTGRHCSPTDVAVKENIKFLISECKEHEERCTQLESHMAELRSERDLELMKKFDMDARLEDLDKENRGLHQQVKMLDSERCELRKWREQQMMDKDKFFLYLCELATKAKIDHLVASKMKLDELQDVILARVGQFARGEFPVLNTIDAHADRIAGLNRKVSRLQDQLSSKEVQLNLWKSRAVKFEQRTDELSQLESQLEIERTNSQTTAARERRTDLENCKLRSEINRLKADLLEMTHAKERKSIEKAHDDERLLELKKLLEQQEKEMQRLKSACEESVKVLVERLSSQEQMTEQLKRSEGELVEFRALIGRLLGLDVGSLTVPNFDILTKLEELIKEHNEPICPWNDEPEREQSLSPMGRTISIHGSREFVATPIHARAGSKEAQMKNTVPLSVSGNFSSPTKSESAYYNTSQKKVHRSRSTRVDKKKY